MLSDLWEINMDFENVSKENLRNQLHFILGDYINNFGLSSLTNLLMNKLPKEMIWRIVSKMYRKRIR